MRKLFGWLLVAVPFVLMFLGLALQDGWVSALLVLVLAGVLAGVLLAGVFLITGRP